MSSRTDTAASTASAPVEQRHSPLSESSMNEQQLAWLGDSVLGLVMREWLLDTYPRRGSELGELFAWSTSNDFLSAFGQPTSVEAGIGRIYLREGIRAAMRYVQSDILPLAQKRIENRLKTR